MRLRTTLLLLFLVIALGAVILGIERFMPSTRELREMKKGPVQFERAKITQIELDSSGGDGITLAWDGTQWWVRRPFNDLADPVKVAKLLTEISSIGWIQRVHQNQFDEPGWTMTSLGQPRHKLRLTAGGQRVLDCALGAPSAIEGAHYLTLQPVVEGGEVAHYVAKTALPDLLKITPKEWRDAKLLRLPASLVTSVKLIQVGGQIEISRQNDKAPWMLVKPLNTRGSKERISELLSTLLNIEIRDAANPAGSGSPASSTGLQTPEIKIVVALKGLEQTPYEVTLKKPAKDTAETTATLNHRKPVFTVMSKSLADLWAQPNDLRDRMLARIDEDAVYAIQITSTDLPPVNLRKESDSWFLQRHGRLEPANGDRIARFFEDLNTHAIQEFTVDTASNLTPYGLDTPFLTASWTEAGARPVKLLFGTNSASTQFFAKYEDEPSVYRIEASLLPSIPQDGIKWKGLGALRFTQFALRRISLALGTAPPLILNYDPITAQWTGQIAGRDITPQLDRVKADKLASALAKFSVHNWSSDRSDALAALKNPALRIIVTLGEPGINTGPVRDISLNFAPTQAGNMESAFFFGQVDADPDIFYIARTSLLALLDKVLKTE